MSLRSVAGYSLIYLKKKMMSSVTLQLITVTQSLTASHLSDLIH